MTARSRLLLSRARLSETKPDSLVHRDAEALERGLEVLPLLAQLVGDRGQVGVEPAHLRVVVGQHRGEGLEVLHGAEEVVAAAREGGQGRGEVVHRAVELPAVAVEVGRRGAQQLVEGPVLVGAVGAERNHEVVEALRDTVELDGNRGALQRDSRAGGERRTRLVDRQQLDVAVGDEGGRDDRGLGRGRHAVLVVVAEGDVHVVALGRHAVDLAHLDPEDADVGARVETDGTREVRADGRLALVRPERDRGRDERDDDEGRDGLAERGHGSVEPAERHTGRLGRAHQRPPPEVPGRSRSGSFVPGRASPGVPTGTTRLETHVSNHRPVPRVLA